MSGLSWWVLALLGLVAVVVLPVRRLVLRTVRSRRVDGDEALVDWIVALRKADDAPIAQPSGARPAGRDCAARERVAARASTAGPSASTRPPQWRGSRRPPTSSRTPFVSNGSGLGSAGPMADEPERGVRPGSSPPTWPVSNPLARPVSGTLARPVSGTLARPVSGTPTGPGSSPPSGPAPMRADNTAASRRPKWPPRYLLLLLLLGSGVAGLLAGPVAAVACGGYGALGVRAWHRRGAAVLRIRARRERLDQLCALAADLRAGLPVPVAAEALGLVRSVSTVRRELAAPATGPTARAQRRDEPALPDPVVPASSTSPGDPSESAGRLAAPDRPGQLAQAAVRLADRTGAPLADLIERIEADARSADRAVAAAAAQAAGARATAWLLAALPLGGIALGYGIGTDPLQVLLHTPIGGACAVAAIALQVVGLLWADRLGTVPDGGS
ncbi:MULTISPECIES: type II secretion system F family protein [Micromonospora]|uniref:type II secretion system F family protein n=1 Tax=Micromonospora TaxID=1873 RepID=UPI001EE2A311|nr:MULTISPECIES: hypothetical protein [Micromonospora]WSK43549.1 hypothetical protein OG712_05180 [Micromonospora maris]